MEILLKKTKITKSILKQVPFATIDSMLNSEVVGYCIDNGSKKIIFYNPTDNSLTWYFYFQEVKPVDDTEFSVKYKTPRGSIFQHIIKYTKGDTFKDVVVFFDNIKHEVEAKGQFYI